MYQYTVCWFSFITSEEQQNISPQNMPLFQAEGNWEEADARKTLSPVAICLKVGHKFVKMSLYYCLPGIKRSYSSETVLDRLLSFRKQHQGNLRNSLPTSSYLPLVSSYIYVPTICHTRNSKCFAFVSSKNF